MRKIVLASNNLGKIKEFQQIFSSYALSIIPQAELAVPECDEPFLSFIENSLHKARHCSLYTGLPAIADDSGLCVEALDGAPGIYSARYAGLPRSDSANISKLLENMQGNNNRVAYFYCSLVMVRSANDPQPIIGDGSLYGEINDCPRGNNGHGYDPIFYIPELAATLAEVSDHQKNQISHRARAMHDLMTKMQSAKLI